MSEGRGNKRKRRRSEPSDVSVPLSSLSPDDWEGLNVTVKSGRFVGTAATVVSTGNGWVQLVTADGDIFAKRAHQLGITENSFKKKQSAAKDGETVVTARPSSAGANKVIISRTTVRRSAKTSSRQRQNDNNSLLNKQVLIIGGTYKQQQGVVKRKGPRNKWIIELCLQLKFTQKYVETAKYAHELEVLPSSAEAVPRGKTSRPAQKKRRVADASRSSSSSPAITLKQASGPSSRRSAKSMASRPEQPEAAVERSTQPKTNKNSVVMTDMNLPPAGSTRRACVHRNKNVLERKRRIALAFVESARRKLRPNRPNLRYWLKQITDSYAKIVNKDEDKPRPEQDRNDVVDIVAQKECPFCGSEMQENDMFCWSLKCDMSPAFTPDGMWGEDSNELKSDTQMSSLLALDEQARIKWIGETSLGYGANMKENGAQDSLSYRWHSWGRGNPKEHPFSNAALALVKMNNSKVTTEESRALKKRAAGLIRHVSERGVIPSLVRVAKVPAVGMVRPNEIAQHRRNLLGVNPRMQSQQQQQQQHFELERMRALRASHPLNPSPALISPVHGRRGPFLTSVAQTWVMVR